MSARRYYAVAFIGVVALGLASRRYPGLFPAFLGKYPGDALWALMLFCVLGFLNPGLPTLWLAVYALLVSYVDEFSQIYQAPWINEIRGTYVGHLILGSTFSWFDMLAYTVGVAFGALCKAIRRKPAFQINGAVNSIPVGGPTNTSTIDVSPSAIATQCGNHSQYPYDPKRKPPGRGSAGCIRNSQQRTRPLPQAERRLRWRPSG